MNLPDTSTIEQAILAVLTGTPLTEAARRAQTSPEHLAEATERYRDAGRLALDPQLGDWHQMNIEFTDRVLWIGPASVAGLQARSSPRPTEINAEVAIETQANSQAYARADNQGDEARPPQVAGPPCIRQSTR